MSGGPPPLAVTMGKPAGIKGETLPKARELLRATGPTFLALGDLDRPR